MNRLISRSNLQLKNTISQYSQSEQSFEISVDDLLTKLQNMFKCTTGGSKHKKTKHKKTKRKGKQKKHKKTKHKKQKGGVNLLLQFITLISILASAMGMVSLTPTQLNDFELSINTLKPSIAFKNNLGIGRCSVITGLMSGLISSIEEYHEISKIAFKKTIDNSHTHPSHFVRSSTSIIGNLLKTKIREDNVQDVIFKIKNNLKINKFITNDITLFYTSITTVSFNPHAIIIGLSKTDMFIIDPNRGNIERDLESYFTKYVEFDEGITIYYTDIHQTPFNFKDNIGNIFNSDLQLHNFMANYLDMPAYSDYNANNILKIKEKNSALKYHKVQQNPELTNDNYIPEDEDEDKSSKYISVYTTLFLELSNNLTKSQ